MPFLSTFHSSSKLDAEREGPYFRTILRIPYTRHIITNVEVRTVSGCPPLSNMATEQSTRFFGHITCSAPCAVTAAIHKPPSDWKRPPGRTQLHVAQRPLNISPSYSQAASREHWCSTVDTATLKKSMPWREEEY